MRKSKLMSQSSTFFLKSVLLLIAVGVLSILVFVLPAGIRTDSVGYYRPILFGLYIPAIPFFFALYESYMLLNLIDENKAFSEASVEAFKNIKYCGVIISALFALGMPYIYYAAELDDAPGVILIGLVIIFASLVVATFAAVLQKLLQSAVEIKSENDLTV